MKKRITAILLCFFLGGLGMHNFYLNKNACGVGQLILLILGIFTLGLTYIAVSIWVIIDLICLMGDDDEAFNRKYNKVQGLT